MRPRLLMVIAEDWYFWSHRLHIAQAAQRAGYDDPAGFHAPMVAEFALA